MGLGNLFGALFVFALLGGLVFAGFTLSGTLGLNNGYGQVGWVSAAMILIAACLYMVWNAAHPG